MPDYRLVDADKLDSDLTNIADKIREKTGGSDTYTIEEMPSGVDAAFEAGVKSEYDRFWDNYQQNGERTNYDYAFAGLRWTDETFLPKYNVKPTSAGHIFSATAITNLPLMLKKTGVEIDFSNLVSASYIAQNSKFITHFPICDMRKMARLDHLFFGCDKLQSIEKIILKDDGSQTFSQYSFYELPKLEELFFEGVIGKSGIALQASVKLSKASITNIIQHLSTTTNGLSITLSNNAVNNAFETSTGAADGSTSADWLALVATKSNWTISLV